MPIRPKAVVENAEHLIALQDSSASMTFHRCSVAAFGPDVYFRGPSEEVFPLALQSWGVEQAGSGQFQLRVTVLDPTEAWDYEDDIEIIATLDCSEVPVCVCGDPGNEHAKSADDSRLFECYHTGCTCRRYRRAYG